MRNIPAAAFTYSYDGTTYSPFNALQVTGGGTLTITNPFPGISLATINVPSTTMSWQTPTLQNSWVNYGGVYEPAGYYKDSTGRVFLRGLVKSGTVGSTTPVFTLPSGYIPPYTAIVASASNDAFCEIRVQGTGDTTPGSVAVWSGGSNVWLSLSGISFLTY